MWSSWPLVRLRASFSARRSTGRPGTGMKAGGRNGCGDGGKGEPRRVLRLSRPDRDPSRARAGRRGLLPGVQQRGLLGRGGASQTALAAERPARLRHAAAAEVVARVHANRMTAVVVARVHVNRMTAAVGPSRGGCAEAVAGPSRAGGSVVEAAGRAGADTAASGCAGRGLCSRCCRPAIPAREASLARLLPRGRRDERAAQARTGGAAMPWVELIIIF